MEDMKIKLAFLWTAHYLIWSFGDFVSLLSEGYIENEIPVSNEIILAAAIIGTLHVSTIIGSITLNGSQNRLFNLILGAIFALIDIANLGEWIVDDRPAGLILLAVVYIIISVNILWQAWNWKAK